MRPDLAELLADWGASYEARRFSTPWGEAESLTVDEYAAWRKGGVRASRAALCATFAEGFEWRWGPGAAMVAAVALVRRMSRDARRERRRRMGARARRRVHGGRLA